MNVRNPRSFRLPLALAAVCGVAVDGFPESREAPGRIVVANRTVEGHEILVGVDSGRSRGSAIEQQVEFPDCVDERWLEFHLVGHGRPGHDIVVSPAADPGTTVYSDHQHSATLTLPRPGDIGHGSRAWQLTAAPLRLEPTDHAPAGERAGPPFEDDLYRKGDDPRAIASTLRGDVAVVPETGTQEPLEHLNWLYVGGTANHRALMAFSLGAYAKDLQGEPPPPESGADEAARATAEATVPAFRFDRAVLELDYEAVPVQYPRDESRCRWETAVVVRPRSEEGFLYFVEEAGGGPTATLRLWVTRGSLATTAIVQDLDGRSFERVETMFALGRADGSSDGPDEALLVLGTLQGAKRSSLLAVSGSVAREISPAEPSGALDGRSVVAVWPCGGKAALAMVRDDQPGGATPRERWIVLGLFGERSIAHWALEDDDPDSLNQMAVRRSPPISIEGGALFRQTRSEGQTSEWFLLRDEDDRDPGGETGVLPRPQLVKNGMDALVPWAAATTEDTWGCVAGEWLVLSHAKGMAVFRIETEPGTSPGDSMYVLKPQNLGSGDAGRTVIRPRGPFVTKALDGAIVVLFDGEGPDRARWIRLGPGEAAGSEALRKDSDNLEEAEFLGRFEDWVLAKVRTRLEQPPRLARIVLGTPPRVEDLGWEVGPSVADFHAATFRAKRDGEEQTWLAVSSDVAEAPGAGAASQLLHVTRLDARGDPQGGDGASGDTSGPRLAGAFQVPKNQQDLGEAGFGDPFAGGIRRLAGIGRTVIAAGRSAGSAPCVWRISEALADSRPLSRFVGARLLIDVRPKIGHLEISGEDIRDFRGAALGESSVGSGPPPEYIRETQGKVSLDVAATVNAALGWRGAAHPTHPSDLRGLRFLVSLGGETDPEPACQSVVLKIWRPSPVAASGPYTAAAVTGEFVFDALPRAADFGTTRRGFPRLRLQGRSGGFTLALFDQHGVPQGRERDVIDLRSLEASRYQLRARRVQLTPTWALPSREEPSLARARGVALVRMRVPEPGKTIRDFVIADRDLSRVGTIPLPEPLPNSSWGRIHHLDPEVFWSEGNRPLPSADGRLRAFGDRALFVAVATTLAARVVDGTDPGGSALLRCEPPLRLSDLVRVRRLDLENPELRVHAGRVLDVASLGGLEYLVNLESLNLGGLDLMDADGRRKPPTDADGDDDGGAPEISRRRYGALRPDDLNDRGRIAIGSHGEAPSLPFFFVEHFDWPVPGAPDRYDVWSTRCGVPGRYGEVPPIHEKARFYDDEGDSDEIVGEPWTMSYPFTFLRRGLAEGGGSLAWRDVRGPRPHEGVGVEAGMAPSANPAPGLRCRAGIVFLRKPEDLLDLLGELGKDHEVLRTLGELDAAGLAVDGALPGAYRTEQVTAPGSTGLVYANPEPSDASLVISSLLHLPFEVSLPSDGAGAVTIGGGGGISSHVDLVAIERAGKELRP